jgi:hypothetical protein
MIASPTALSLPLRTPAHTARVPSRAPAVRPRFTTDGSGALEEHLDAWCAKIAAAVRGIVGSARLEALLLGGGYGRGEGGVLRSATRCRAGSPNPAPIGSTAAQAGFGDPALQDRPYNDVEFYVFLRGNRHLNERRFGRALHVLGEILTPQVGAEVEFKIASLPELAAAEVSMFSYDLLSGHRLLYGAPDLLAPCAGHRDGERIPLAEATRLLMNRGSGLLFAHERIERATFTAADADFVRRNIAKAQLALGDALLVAHREYHWSARERHRLVERLARTQPMPWMEDVRVHHARGVEFKFHPCRSTESAETLRADHQAITALAEKVFLWIEERRLGRAFASTRDYVGDAIEKFPAAHPLRMMLQQMKAFGSRSLIASDVSCHPRDRVMHALALLLWTPPGEEAAVLRQIQRELDTSARAFPDLVTAYRERWQFLN